MLEGVALFLHCDCWQLLHSPSQRRLRQLRQRQCTSIAPDFSYFSSPPLSLSLSLFFFFTVYLYWAANSLENKNRNNEQRECERGGGGLQAIQVQQRRRQFSKENKAKIEGGRGVGAGAAVGIHKHTWRTWRISENRRRNTQQMQQFPVLLFSIS